MHGENQHQQHGDPKARHRLAHDRDQTDADIHHRAPPQGGENTQGYRQQAAGDDGQAGKDQRELQVLQYERSNGC